MNKSVRDFHSVDRQFWKYVVPSVISMIVSSIYIILDGVFVGQGIGELALGAVNIAFPFLFFVMSLTLLVSIGGANVYSFLRGGEVNAQVGIEKANNVFCQCVGLLTMIGILLGILGFAFSEQLARLLGANEELLPYAAIFLKWLAPFVLLQTIVIGVGTFIRNDGGPKLVMVSSIICSVINVLLEFIFIMVMNRGIEYTAFANGISMAVQLIIFVHYFACKRGTLRLLKPTFSWHDMKRIFANGISTFLMEFSQSTVAFSFNLAFIHTVGTIGVSAYAIVTYIGAIIYSVLIGVVQGAQPIMSFSHGIRDEKVVYHAYRLGLRMNTAAAALYIIACFVFGSGMVSLFHTGNQELTNLTAQMLRLMPLAYLAIGITVINILYFQTTERNVYSTIVSFLRCIGFVQVLLLICVPLFHTAGIYMALIAGEACNCIVSAVFVRKTIKVLGAKNI